MPMLPDEPNPGASPAPDWSQAWADYYAWYAWAAAQSAQTAQAGPAQAAETAHRWPAPYPAAAVPPAAVGAMSVPPLLETSAAPSPAMVETSSTAYAVELVATCPARSSRTWAILSLLLLKTASLLPHLLILAVFLVVGAFVFLLAQAAVLFTARYPRAFYSFIVGVLRWQLRVRAFALGLTDRYPPFALDSSEQIAYPVDLIVRRPVRSSRLWAFNYFLSVVSVSYFVDPSAALWLTTRTAATLPHVFILVPLIGALFWAWLVAQFIVVGKGAYPRGLHEFVAGCLRWSVRVEAFWFGLTDKYPPFELASAPPSPAAAASAPDAPPTVAQAGEMGYKPDSPAKGESPVGH